MQPVRVEIGAVWPGYDAEFDTRFLEYCRIGQRCEYAGIRGGDQDGKIGKPTRAVDKGHGKLISGPHADGCNPPRCSRNYSRGSIRFGDCFD